MFLPFDRPVADRGQRTESTPDRFDGSKSEGDGDGSERRKPLRSRDPNADRDEEGAREPSVCGGVVAGDDPYS